MLALTGPGHSNDQMFVEKNITITHEITRRNFAVVVVCFCSFAAGPQPDRHSISKKCSSSSFHQA